MSLAGFREQSCWAVCAASVPGKRVWVGLRRRRLNLLFSTIHLLIWNIVTILWAMREVGSEMGLWGGAGEAAENMFIRVTCGGIERRSQGFRGLAANEPQAFGADRVEVC